MLPIIRFKTKRGADVICVVRGASADQKDDVNIYEHGDPDSDAFWVVEPGVTLDDVEHAINASLQGRCVTHVVGTRHQTPAFSRSGEKE